jgi:hypothetical protein
MVQTVKVSVASPTLARGPGGSSSEWVKLMGSSQLPLVPNQKLASNFVGLRRRAHVLKQMADVLNSQPHQGGMGLAELVNTGEGMQ